MALIRPTVVLFVSGLWDLVSWASVISRVWWRWFSDCLGLPRIFFVPTLPAFGLSWTSSPTVWEGCTSRVGQNYEAVLTLSQSPSVPEAASRRRALSLLKEQNQSGSGYGFRIKRIQGSRS